MLHKMSILIGAAAVALGAGAGFADPFDTDRSVNDRPVCSSDSSCDQNRTAFGNGYRYGYDNGLAHRPRDDRAGAFEFGSPNHSSIGGSYYYISAARDRDSPPSATAN
jgi:hypothetical protein